MGMTFKIIVIVIAISEIIALSWGIWQMEKAFRKLEKAIKDQKEFNERWV
jgi:cytochrome oxidase assembly protein ShyY1